MNATAIVNTTYANLQAYVNLVHALGANAKVIVATEFIQCDILAAPVKLAAMQDYNTRIKTGWNKPQSTGGLQADGFADYQADTVIGPGNYTSSNLCSNTAISPDGQHPTDTAMGYFAAVKAAVVNLFLNILSN